MVKLCFPRLATVGTEPYIDRRLGITNGKHIFSFPKYCFLHSGFLISNAHNPRVVRTNLMPRQMLSRSRIWFSGPRQDQKRTIIHYSLGCLLFFLLMFLLTLRFLDFFFLSIFSRSLLPQVVL